MYNLKEEIQSAVGIYKSGNLSKAENISKKLLKENPKIVFLYNLLGLILSEQKKVREAIECYKKGIETDPKYAMNYNNLGQLYFNIKEKTITAVSTDGHRLVKLEKETKNKNSEGSIIVPGKFFTILKVYLLSSMCQVAEVIFLK